MESRDTPRLIGDLLRLATVVAVDRAAATCRVKMGDIETGDLPWLERRAGDTRTWSPPSIGEQLLLLCPEGDIESGLVLPGLFCNAFPAPSAAGIDLILFKDDAEISYDAAAHKLVAKLPAGGTAEITAPGGLTITGDVTITGAVTVSKTLTAADDVIGGGKSLKGHKHLGVTAGGAQTGLPA